MVLTLPVCHPLVFTICLQCAPWLEFVPMWKVKGQLNSLVEEWMQVAAYQKTLPSKSHPHESSPDTGVCVFRYSVDW